jgi:hypothetical protein
LGIHEGENVETNTDLQPKKSLSRKRRLTKNEETISLIISNDWNPFERADPRVLEKVKQKFTKMKNYQYEDALL